jgi:hypothetical protein
MVSGRDLSLYPVEHEYCINGLGLQLPPLSNGFTFNTLDYSFAESVPLSSTTIQIYAIAALSTFFNIGVLWHHWTRPPHPKFLLLTDRMISIRFEPFLEEYAPVFVLICCPFSFLKIVITN